jgi:hypothetical protein
MTVIYTQGWDFAKIGPFEIRIVDPVDGTEDISFSTGTYAHNPYSSVAATSSYSLFSAALQTAINTACPSGSYTVSFAGTTTAYYTIERGSSTFTLTFRSGLAGNAGERAAHMLGFQGTPTFSAATAISATSNAVPYYAIVADVSARTSYTGIVHQRGRSRVAISDDGVPFHAAKHSPTRVFDWTQVYEAQAKCFAANAAAAAPWTWDQFVTHGATGEPCLVYDSNTSTAHVYKLREDGCDFTYGDVVEPSAGDPNYVAYWDVRHRGYYLGAI